MATISQGMRNRLPQLSKKTIIIGAVVAVLIAVGIAIPALQSQSTASAVGTTMVAAPVDIRADITATGKMTPIESANLSYAIGGRVAKVYVVSGDTVAVDAPLVQLDQTMLTLEQTSALAVVDQAKADVAVATAQLAGAEAVLVQTVGSVGAAEIGAARANLTAAQERLALLSNGTRPEQIARAQSAVTDAQGTLDTQRKNLSGAKTQADTLVEQRANAVRDAQTTFNAARADLAHVEADGTDPRTGRELSDAQKRDFADAFTTAERALTNAQGILLQAQRDADVARQNEISGVASAEARVATAQADLTALTSGAGADLATAQATVASAEANLNKVIGSQRDAAVAAQEANVAAAKAGLDRANGKLTQATAQAQMAGVRLDDTILTAPFAGVVAQVDAKVGELVGSAPVVSVLNLSAFEVKVTVDEVDVANIAVGQPVIVLVDALGAPTLNGSVVRVSPEAQSDRGVVSYEVIVNVTPDDRSFKSGMTASAQIVTAEAKGVIGVPRSAISEVDGVSMVMVVEDGKRVERVVTVGLRGNEMTEITSGLKAGDVVEVTAVSQ